MKPYDLRARLADADAGRACPQCAQPTRLFSYRCPLCAQTHTAATCFNLGHVDGVQRCKAIDVGCDHASTFADALVRELATLSAELVADMSAGLEAVA